MKLAYTLTIGPRTGKKSRHHLMSARITDIICLLSSKEDAGTGDKFAKFIGAEWHAFPIEGGKLETLQTINLDKLYLLSNSLSQSENTHIYLHCSAGIHRTGFIAYLLHRFAGFDDSQARQELAAIRAVTAEQVGEDRLQLAQDMYDRWKR